MPSESTTSIDGAAAAQVEEFAESLTAARLVRTIGKVAVVVTEAGHEQVTVRTDSGPDVSFAASASLVAQAGALLGQPVVATGLGSSQGNTPARLLRLNALDADVAGDAEQRLASLAAQWSVALEALSK